MPSTSPRGNQPGPYTEPPPTPGEDPAPAAGPDQLLRAEDDQAALRTLLAANAVRVRPGTGTAMPNAAPPLTAPARRHRSTAGAVPAPASRPRPSSTAAGAVPAGLPAAWAGFGSLLAGVTDRLPDDALTISTASVATEDRSTGLDFSGMWALPAAQAPLRSQVLIRALDSKGRLQLPVAPEQADRLAAERDGAVVTVFLPGSTGSPRHGFSTAPQPMDARGRLTLTAALRREAGIGEGADVLAQLDPVARTVTVVAAGHMDSPIAAAIAGLRRSASAHPDGRTAPVPETPTEAGTEAAPAGAATPAPPVRLRIVG